MLPIHIQYIFKLPDGQKDTFILQLDQHNLNLLTDDKNSLPDWSRLSFQQCPNCVDMEKSTWCPMAVNLSRIVHRFASLLSYDEVHLTVITAEREFRQKTTIQRAISSYMGLVMATCGCPHTKFLRPMARFHLPLASEEETIYRAFSMYALAQYFIARDNGTADPEFKGLEQAYKEIQVINQAMAQRLRAASEKDSSVNALINLDMYARAMPYVLEESLEELQYLFDSYLNKKSKN